MFSVRPVFSFLCVGSLVSDEGGRSSCSLPVIKAEIDAGKHGFLYLVGSSGSWSRFCLSGEAGQVIFLSVFSPVFSRGQRTGLYSLT